LLRKDALYKAVENGALDGLEFCPFCTFGFMMEDSKFVDRKTSAESSLVDCVLKRVICQRLVKVRRLMVFIRVEAAEEEKERLQLSKKNSRDSDESDRYVMQLRQCPKCMAPYEKSGGCANMHCAKCGHLFKDGSREWGVGLLF
jgi:hypothetical protein